MDSQPTLAQGAVYNGLSCVDTIRTIIPSEVKGQIAQGSGVQVKDELVADVISKSVKRVALVESRISEYDPKNKDKRTIELPGDLEADVHIGDVDILNHTDSDVGAGCIQVLANKTRCYLGKADTEEGMAAYGYALDMYLGGALTGTVYTNVVESIPPLHDKGGNTWQYTVSRKVFANHNVPDKITLGLAIPNKLSKNRIALALQSQPLAPQASVPSAVPAVK